MSDDTQPKDLMTLEDRINAIINNPQLEKELCMRGILLPEFQCDWHTFGGFDGMPEKYRAAILATEKQAEKRVIPLEDVTENLGNLARFYALNGQPSTERILLSALHHLEAGRKDLKRLATAVTLSLPAKYLAWANAGGVDECEHGCGAGIPCFQCDLAFAESILSLKS